MGDDIGLSSVCFGFHSTYIVQLSLSSMSSKDLRRQAVTESKLMTSPINYPD